MALTDNIVAYYKCDDVNDSVGSYNLTNAGTTTFSSGLIGNGADFGSSNTTKRLYILNDLGITTNFSFSCRRYATSNSKLQKFLWWGEASSKIAFQYYWDNSDGKLYALRTKRGIESQGPAITYTLPQNTRTHFVVTYDGSNIKVFANGVYLGVASASGDGSSSCVDSFGFGGYDYYSQAGCDGKMDEVGVWTRALTDGGVSVGQTAGGEVADLYNSGNGLQYPFSTTNIKSINGLAKSSIKSINGLAIASVKSWNWLS